MVSHMKTTVDLPDELLLEAKIRAAQERRTLKDLIEAGLRKELRRSAAPRAGKPITWVTAAGGLPADVDMADRRSWSRLMRRNK